MDYRSLKTAIFQGRDMDYFFKQRNLSGQDMVRVPYIFHLAVQANNQSLAFDLLMLKPELASSFDSRGQTPIVTAFIHGNYEIVEKLLRFDPSICRLPSQGGLNILHHIVRGERSLDQLLVKVLINCPECINDKTLDLKNVFHFAAGRNTSSYLDYLLGHLYFLDDIDVKDNFLNMRDIHGDTPLHVAVRKNNFELVDMLLKQHVEVNLLNCDGKTPLDLLLEQSPILDSNLLKLLESKKCKKGGSVQPAPTSWRRDSKCSRWYFKFALYATVGDGRDNMKTALLGVALAFISATYTGSLALFSGLRALGSETNEGGNAEHSRRNISFNAFRKFPFYSWFYFLNCLLLVCFVARIFMVFRKSRFRFVVSLILVGMVLIYTSASAVTAPSRLGYTVLVYGILFVLFARFIVCLFTYFGRALKRNEIMIQRDIFRY